MAKAATRPRDRHSYIHFYPENWLAGVAGLPRMVRSVLFDICLYNWDKAASIPQALLQMQISDLPEEQAAYIVEMLIDAGKIERNEDGSLFSPRAMEESQRAYDMWAAKVAGGRKSTSKTSDVSSKSEKSVPEVSSRLVPKHDVTPNSPGANLEDSSEDTSNSPRTETPFVAKTEDTSKIAGTDLDRTKNLEPREERKETSDDVSKRKQQQDSIPVRDAVEADALLRATQAEADRLRKETAEGIALIAETWNRMALTHGWPQITKMTEKRQTLAAARIADHGTAKIVAALEAIPESDYLMGRTSHGASPSFDWLMGEDVCANLAEGFYHRDKPEDEPEKAKAPDLIVTHPEECETSARVRSWLIDTLGGNTFAHEFRSIKFHVKPELEGVERLIVEAESPAINLGDFMIRHRSILNRAAKEFDLLEPWAT